jgi:peptidoglycan/xylan/chitin deacetylase (PgdA/CDA1 family)
MYHCLNIQKFLKFIITDAVIIVVLALFIKFSGINWSALNYEYENEKGIFLPVIMYHSIVDDSSKECQYVVTPETIENDMKYLKEHGYETILTEDLVNYISEDKPLPEKPVMITLDDGFYNNVYYLLPLLEKYDMKAIISVVGKFVDEASEHDAHNPDYSYLTWKDISDISDSPHFEIGNHTYDMHSTSSRKGCSMLYNESTEEYSEILYADLGKLQSLLETNVHIKPVAFAYPFGYISRESIPVLQELGFIATFNCYEKPNYITKDLKCLYGLNRYNRASGISTQQFMEKLLKE